MTRDKYNDFRKWYDVTKGELYNFKHEMVKYCRADVELLGKAVLQFRRLFKAGLDVDPFRYVTLPSLTMSIYRAKFMPRATIVANDQNKKVS